MKNTQKKKGKKDCYYLEWKLDSAWVAANQIFTVKQKKKLTVKRKLKVHRKEKDSMSEIGKRAEEEHHTC